MNPVIARINAMERDAFVQAFGAVFENSPWVAERAWEARPFADFDALHAAMVGVVRAAPHATQLALLRAHPDLAGREAQAGTMSGDSVSEQASAGLDALTREELARIAALNAAYRAKHGFPFIIAVRQHGRDGILAEFERRLGCDSAAEFEACLAQVFVITRLRLAAMPS